MRWLVLAALLLSLDARAQQAPSWFAPSFLDIREDVAEAAKEGCPVSQALKGNVPFELDARLA